jgi:hypothetical protein
MRPIRCTAYQYNAKVCSEQISQSHSLCTIRYLQINGDRYNIFVILVLWFDRKLHAKENTRHVYQVFSACSLSWTSSEPPIGLKFVKSLAGLVSFLIYKRCIKKNPLEALRHSGFDQLVGLFQRAVCGAIFSNRTDTSS